MHTSGSHHRRLVWALALAIAVLAVGGAEAQEAPAAGLFGDARSLEMTLRKEIGAYRSGTPSLPLVRRARILVGTYEDIARLFPESGYGDKALWQGASLAADVFDVFKDGLDRASAVRLTEVLESKYPGSALLNQAHRRVATLALAPAVAPTPAIAPPVRPAATAPATVARTVAQAPVVAPPRTLPASRVSAPAVSTLLAIRRQVLPDVLRVSLEFDREATFNAERIEGPARVFVDLSNTRATASVEDARLGFDEDVVRQIRVGRQLEGRIRVVLDLSNAPVHSVYTLYSPFRIVVDFERQHDRATQTGRAPAVAVSSPRPAELPPVAASLRVAPARTTPLVVTPTPVASPVAVPPAPPKAAIVIPDAKASVNIQPGSTATPVPPTMPAPKRDTVSPAPLPARTPGGLSISRQLGLGVARVVIDPGHGGHDPGATDGGLAESDLVLDVALKLEALLQKRGIEVVLTRRTNVYVALEERPAIAMRDAADIYLSIHANASQDRRVRGVETYILNFAPNAQSAAVAARENVGSARTMTDLSDIVRTIALNNKFDESRDLARQVQAALVEKLSKGNRTVRNLGVKQAPFAVLVGAEVPSILAEIGFITNKQDAALVKTASYRQQIAEALATGIDRYQKRLKPAQVAAAGQ